MPESAGEVSPEIVNRKNAEALAESLRQFPKPLKEAEQLILEYFAYVLTDPIERLKLGPSGQFSEEEETVLRDLERGTP